ncbi:hypothetical protein GMO_09380 [Gluconobacter morbifer G707]|uniref:Transmembrane protein n=2 Tax=Gluconobacter TaxID=441 RepID=G6XHH2_9PROT|nr:hypothetical protein GMO_09380 [Gluconobacter morbifer G707]
MGKALAGLVLGATASIGLMGVAGLLFHADAAVKTPAALILRWLPGPIWGLILAFSFLFPSALRAWLGLASANIVIWGVFFFLRGVMA